MLTNNESNNSNTSTDTARTNENIFNNKIDLQSFEDMNDNDNHSSNESTTIGKLHQDVPAPSSSSSTATTTLMNNIQHYLSNQQQFTDLQQNSDDSFVEGLTSNMLSSTTSLLDHHGNNSRQHPMIGTSTTNSDDKDDLSLNFSNLNINESSTDKFWSLDPTVAASSNDDFTINSQPYSVDNLTQSPFTEQSLVQKIQAQSNQQQQQQQQQQLNMKLNHQLSAMNYGSGQQQMNQSPLNRPLLVSQNSSLYNNNNANLKTSNQQLNCWPRSPQVQQTSLHSNGLTWSNAFGNAASPSSSGNAFGGGGPSVSSCMNNSSSPYLSSSGGSSNVSPNIQTANANAWSSALYNHQQKNRNQLANQNTANNSNSNSMQNASPSPSMTNKKHPFFNNNENQFIADANQKFVRRSANILPPSMKNFPSANQQTTQQHLPGQSAVSNIYDLGSAGSDNTSSSSDSANLRENGLLFHDKTFEQSTHHQAVLDSFRGNSLEPQLCDMLKTSQEANKSMYNTSTTTSTYPCQPTLQDDKKHLKGRFNRRRGKSPFFTGNDADSLFNEFPISNNDPNERYSRKVFVGGLPPDIDEEEITASFRRFGHLIVDWPHKAESKSYFPPKGYAFLLFQDESSVQTLIDTCIQDDDKLYLCVSSPTMKDKPVQIRPWRLSDADYVLDASMPLDPRKTVFVGGVPRPLKAVELAMIMDRLYGGVCYAGIDTDPELKYPKGAGRVAFSNQQSYIAAISARFVQLQHADIEKRVEVKPYVLDDQICDECQGARCNGKYAPYFCANITCLQYYCENCWATIHSRPGREFHKPLVKEGADRPRAIPFRWC